MADFNLQGDVTLQLKKAEKQIQKLRSDLSKDLKLNVSADAKKIESLSRPLGKITANADEFNKSMEASNARIIAFGASAAVLASVAKSFQAVFESTRKVELALTKIQSITNSTSASIKQLGSTIFGIAKETGQSFDVAAEAALEFSRQGLGAEETAKRLKAAMILVRTEGVSASQAVEGLTSVINGFSSAGLNATEILNKFSAVSNSFALSNKDLFEGFKRAASVAQEAGLSVEQFSGVIASVQQQTARGGAVIGNAFKTIFTRLNNTSTLNALEEIGVQTRTLNGDLRDGISILKDVAKATQGLDSVARSNIFEKIAGKRQIALLIPLINDLNKEYSIFAGAVDKANKATDEAEKKNELLSGTIDGVIQRIKSLGVELASGVGAAFADDIKGALVFVENSLDKIKNLASSDIGQGFLKGLTTILSGPALVIGLAAITKLFGQFASFAIKGVAGLSGLSKKSKEMASTQMLISKVLEKNEVITQRLVAGKISEKQAAKRVLDLLKLQTLESQKRATIEKSISGIILSSKGGKGVVRNSFVPNKADGLKGALFREDKAIKKGVGGASKKSKPILIEDFNFGNRIGSLVANTSEYIVRDPKGDSILTKDMFNSLDSATRSGAKPIGNAADGIINQVLPNGVNSKKQLKKVSKLNTSGFNSLKTAIDNVSKGSQTASQALNKLKMEISDSSTNFDVIEKTLKKTEKTFSSMDKVIKNVTKNVARKSVEAGKAKINQLPRAAVFPDSSLIGFDNESKKAKRVRDFSPEKEKKESPIGRNARIGRRLNESTRGIRSRIGGISGTGLGVGGLLLASSGILGTVQNLALGKNSSGETNSRFEASFQQRGLRDGIDGLASGATTGALIGTVIPGIGTLAGGVIGGLVGLGASLYNSSLTLEEFSSAVSEEQKKIREKSSTLESVSSNISNVREAQGNIVGGLTSKDRRANASLITKSLSELSGVLDRDLIEPLKSARSSLVEFDKALQNATAEQGARDFSKDFALELENTIKIGKEKGGQSDEFAKARVDLDKFVEDKIANVSPERRNAIIDQLNKDKDFLTLQEINGFLDSDLREFSKRFGDTAKKAFIENGRVAQEFANDKKGRRASDLEKRDLFGTGVRSKLSGEALRSAIAGVAFGGLKTEFSGFESIRQASEGFDDLEKKLFFNKDTGKVETPSFLTKGKESELSEAKLLASEIASAKRELKEVRVSRVNNRLESREEASKRLQELSDREVKLNKDIAENTEKLDDSLKKLGIVISAKGVFKSIDDLLEFRSTFKNNRDTLRRSELDATRSDRNDRFRASIRTNQRVIGRLQSIDPSLRDTSIQSEISRLKTENARIDLAIKQRTSRENLNNSLQTFKIKDISEEKKLTDLKGFGGDNLGNTLKLQDFLRSGLNKDTDKREVVTLIESVLKGVNDRDVANNPIVKELVVLRETFLSAIAKENIDNRKFQADLNSIGDDAIQKGMEALKEESRLSNIYLKSLSEANNIRAKGKLDRFLLDQNFRLSDPREFSDLGIEGRADKVKRIKDQSVARTLKVEKDAIKASIKLELAKIKLDQERNELLSKMALKLGVREAESLGAQGVQDLGFFEKGSNKLRFEIANFDAKKILGAATNFLTGKKSNNFNDIGGTIENLVEAVKNNTEVNKITSKSEISSADIIGLAIGTSSAEEIKRSEKVRGLSKRDQETLVELILSERNKFLSAEEKAETGFKSNRLESVAAKQQVERSIAATEGSARIRRQLSLEDPRSSNVERVGAREDLSRAEAVSDTGKPVFESFSQGVDQSFAAIKDRVNEFSGVIGRETPELFASNMSTALSNMLSGAASFEDAMLNSIKNIADALNQRFSQNIIDNIMSDFDNDFRGGAGSGGSGIFGRRSENAGSGFLSGISSFFGNIFRGAQRRNSGGLVTGGSGVRDDVPAVLTGGEFVVKKSIVDKMGLGFFQQLNGQRFASGGFFDSLGPNGGQFVDSLAGGAATGIISTLIGNRDVRRRNRALDASLAEQLATAGTRQTGPDFFIPSVTTPDGQFRGFIDGKKDLNKFINQNTTSGSTDIISSSKNGFSFALEDQSSKLSGLAQLGLVEGTNIAGEIRSAKSDAFNLLLQQERNDQQAKANRKAKKRGLLGSIAGAVLGGLGSALFGSFSKKSSGAEGQFATIDPVSKKFSAATPVISRPKAPSFNSRFTQPKAKPSSSIKGVGSGDFIPPQGVGSISSALFDPIDVKFAAGGNAMVQGGEMIMSPQSVSAFGRDNLQALNSGGVPKFAAGGFNGSSSSSSGSSPIVEKLDVLIEKTGESKGGITINIENNGASSSSEADNEKDRELAIKIERTVREVIISEQRLGGTLRG